MWLRRCRVQERAWARVVDRCRERPPGENGRKPHEGRQHTASAFSSGWRRWVTAPRITAICLLHRHPLPALPPSISSGGGVRAQCAAHRVRDTTHCIMPPLPARLRRDPAAAGIVTTIRDTVSCSWIFYSECRPLPPYAEIRNSRARTCVTAPRLHCRSFLLRSFVALCACSLRTADENMLNWKVIILVYVMALQ